MRFLRGVFLVVLAVLPLGASTIDVSSRNSVLVPAGDTLIFLASEWNYGADAAFFNAPADPTQVAFNLDLTAAGSVPPDFSQLDAVLQSRDGSLTVPLGSPNVYSGVASFYNQGVSQSTAIWELSGQVNILETLSQELFATSSVYLIIANSGPAVTFSGLPGHTLGQGFTLDFGGGGFTAADPATQVLFDPPDVPEPGSALLALLGLTLAALAGWAARHGGNRRIP